MDNKLSLYWLYGYFSNGYKYRVTIFIKVTQEHQHFERVRAEFGYNQRKKGRRGIKHVIKHIELKLIWRKTYNFGSNLSFQFRQEIELGKIYGNKCKIGFLDFLKIGGKMKLPVKDGAFS